MAYLCLTLIFIYLATCAQAERRCLSPVTDEHLNYLDEMIDAQLKMPCSVKMKLMDNKIVGDYCYKRGVISQLSTLLEKLEFKPNSQSYNYTKRLNDLYNQRFQDCIDENDDLTQEDLEPCSRHTDLNPVQLLERIKMSFVIFRDFKVNSESEVNCYEEYQMCEEEYDHSAKEQRHHGRQNSNLFLVMIPSILAILFLCGLLYSVYRYRRLIRQLNREQVQELHEMRPLATAV
ncbi:macrophage colony-stimulating factor 1-like isoform X3 [Lithobates pipiens]